MCSKTCLSFWGSFSEIASDPLGSTPNSEFEAHVHGLHHELGLHQVQ